MFRLQLLLRVLMLAEDQTEARQKWGLREVQMPINI